VYALEVAQDPLSPVTEQGFRSAHTDWGDEDTGCLVRLEQDVTTGQRALVQELSPRRRRGPRSISQIR